MKAFTVSKYKHPMEAGEVAEPVVGDHDVLVDVHAAGVSLLDAKIRDGEFKLFLPYKAPFILGHDLAGVVARLRSAVTRYVVGDVVYARPRDGRIGTFAERIAVREDDLAIKPRSLSVAEAASVPLVALTAWQALVERANLQPGQKVLIHAGSGGIGTYAIQLAKHGAEVVIDYRMQDFENALQGYDVLLDSQGADTLVKSLRLLKPGGIAIRHRRPAGPGIRPPARTRSSAATGHGAAQLQDAPSGAPSGRSLLHSFMRVSGAQLGAITKRIDAGALRPVVDRTYPFDEAPQALAHLESGRAKGKIVITIV